MASRAQSRPDPFPKLCQAAGLGLPIKEHNFHATRKWRVDYFFPELNLAVEIEGGAFCQGRHTRGAGFREDLRKYNALTLQGIALLRFLPEQMRSLEAISTLCAYQFDKQEKEKAQRVGSPGAGRLTSAGPGASQTKRGVKEVNNG